MVDFFTIILVLILPSVVHMPHFESVCVGMVVSAHILREAFCFSAK